MDNPPTKRTPPEGELVDPSAGRHVAPERISIAQWEGPIPPPQAIEAYNNVSPELGTLLAKNFLDESDHRRTLARNEQRQKWSFRLRGQLAGLLVILLLVGFSWWCVANGHDTVAATAIGGMATVAGLFVWKASGSKTSGDTKDPS